MTKEMIDGVEHVGLLKEGVKTDTGDDVELCSIDAPCRLCGRKTMIHVRRKDYDRWVHGDHVQNAFPYIDPEYRELLISGTCKWCWDEMFGGLEP